MRTVSQSFACQAAAVRDARRLVRDTLHGYDAELIDAAELLTSELASNCVRHARTGFEVRISGREEVRIEVRDCGGGSPRVLSPEAHEPSGRGLLIVETVARRWGVETRPDGKVVWFTLAREPVATPS
ncbi:MAG TPA: ATP-binding protein [Solirubrobacteraceae bacterium]|nr:ATP-binding protein [Solirubrobacteraceae bacterium]